VAVRDQCEAVVEMTRPRKIFIAQDGRKPYWGWRTKLVQRLFKLKPGPKHRFVFMGLMEDNCFMITISASDGEVIAYTAIENESMLRNLIEHMEYAIAHKLLVEE
jgi:hypothetical protein